LIVFELQVEKPEWRIGRRIRDHEGRALTAAPPFLCSSDAVTLPIRGERLVI